jgi:prepilin-type N-terminal cleavage/methylation domain-containing protein
MNWKRLFGDRKKGNGFTLIELLIVIAIILILIAIALPNFLEAQIRARVTKAKSELRTLDIAMTSYYLDWRVYPWESENDCALPGQGRFRCGLAWLSSPVAYIGTIPPDPFGPTENPSWFELGVKANPPGQGTSQTSATWAIWTYGPDNQDTELVSDNAGGGVTWQNKGADMSAENYSATNGTKSLGDIFIFGGDSFWIGVTNSFARKPVQNTKPLVVDGVPYLHQLPPKR